MPIQVSSYYIPFFLKEKPTKHNVQRNLAKEQEVRKIFLVKAAKMGNIRKRKQMNRNIHCFPEAYWLQQGSPRVGQKKHEALL